MSSESMEAAGFEVETFISWMKRDMNGIYKKYFKLYRKNYCMRNSQNVSFGCGKSKSWGMLYITKELKYI